MSRITTYAAIVVLLVVGVLAAGSAYQTATHIYSDTEQVNVSYGATVPVHPSQPAESYLDNETLTNVSGTDLIEGEDYDWNTTTGEITFYNTSATKNEDTATINYSYQGHSDRALMGRGVLSTVYKITAVGLLLGAAGVLGRWSGWLTSGGGR